MKKAFALIVLIVTPPMAFAQGTVGFANNSSELVRQWTSPTDPTIIPVPVGGAQIELLAAPNNTPFTPFGGIGTRFTTLAALLAANPGWVAIPSVSGPTTGIGPVPGRFNGGNVSLQAAIVGGATAEYIVIGWTGSSTTWDDAILAGAFVGSTPLLTTLTGNPQGTPPVPATLLSATFPGMILGTPEPSTFALAGLGAIMLRLFHRRR